MPIIQGKRLEQLRERAGFKTQQDLAKKAKIDPSKLSKLENDKPANLTLKTIERLIRALKIAPRDLFDDARPGKAVGDGDEREKSIAVLEDLRLRRLDEEKPAEDSARGDILKAQSALADANAALNRALRRPDAKSGAA